MVFETIGQFMSKLMFFHGYVNDYNGFPKPLTAEEEEKYVDAMANGDKRAREILINHNMRLVAHVTKKYSGAAEADEMLSVGAIGLIKAVDSFKKDKGSLLSTYASRCIENEILMLLRANKKHKVCVSIEERISIDKDGSELTYKDIIPQNEEDETDVIVHRNVLMDNIKEIMQKVLSKREYDIIAYRYGFKNGVEHTQQETAKMLNISRSYISRIENKALEILKQNMEKT